MDLVFRGKNVTVHAAISYTKMLHTGIFDILYRQFSEFLERHELPGTNARILLSLTGHFGTQPLHYDRLKFFL
jgi:hypothetical protein